MTTTTLDRLQDQTAHWKELCKLVQEADFAPVLVTEDGESIKFDYTSEREQTWIVGTAISLFVGFALVSILSIPFVFLITLGFVLLSKSTDDYLLFDNKERVFSRVTTFFGRANKEKLLSFDSIDSVVHRPVVQQSGQTKWTEHWLELQGKDGQVHPLLTHQESRSEKRALQIGRELAKVLDAPLSGVPEAESQP